MLQGILSEVKYGSKVLNGNWSITGFPLENVKINSTTNNETENLSIADGPVLYESYFTIPDAQPLDTFLDPTGWGKVFFVYHSKHVDIFILLNTDTLMYIINTKRYRYRNLIISKIK